jgi:hypothetical protein
MMIIVAAPDGELTGIACQGCKHEWVSESFVEKAYLVRHEAVKVLIQTQDFPTDAQPGDYYSLRGEQLELLDYAEQQEGPFGYAWLGWNSNLRCRPAPTEPVDGIHPNVLIGLQPDRSYDRPPYRPCVHDVTTEERHPDEIWTRCERCGRVITKRLA